VGPGVADVLPLPHRLANERNAARAALDSNRLDDGMSTKRPAHPRRARVNRSRARPKNA
jgi:hypothetical protein